MVMVVVVGGDFKRRKIEQMTSKRKGQQQKALKKNASSITCRFSSQKWPPTDFAQIFAKASYCFFKNIFCMANLLDKGKKVRCETENLQVTVSDSMARQVRHKRFDGNNVSLTQHRRPFAFHTWMGFRFLPKQILKICLRCNREAVSRQFTLESVMD